MILNGSAHGLLNLKKKTIPTKLIQVHKEKTGNVKCNKTITALHFVQYDVLWSTEKNINRRLRPWSLLLFSAP